MLLPKSHEPLEMLVGEGVEAWCVSGGGFTGTKAEVGEGRMLPKVPNIPDWPCPCP